MFGPLVDIEKDANTDCVDLFVHGKHADSSSMSSQPVLFMSFMCLCDEAAPETSNPGV